MESSSDVVSPSEKRRFANALRKALRELDYQQLYTLVYWQGANENAREHFEINMKHLLAQFSGRSGLKITFEEPSASLTVFGGMTLKPVLGVHIEAQNLGLLEAAGMKDGQL